eukprot:1945754-Amphidinium_carterae.1
MLQPSWTTVTISTNTPLPMNLLGAVSDFVVRRPWQSEVVLAFSAGAACLAFVAFVFRLRQ